MKGTSLVLLAPFFLLLIGCQSSQQEEQLLDSTPNNRAAWNHERLKDPVTGEIPQNMKAREVQFVEPMFEVARASRSGEAGKFYSVGPNNVGGRIRAVAYDAFDNNVLLTGSVSGRVYKSTDNGFTWKMVDQPDAIFGITCIAQDTRSGKSDTWYYGTGEGPGNSQGAHNSATFYGNGIYKSTDKGESWELLPSTSQTDPNLFDYFNFVYRIVTDHTIDTADVVLAAIAGQIVRSTDGGDTWNAVLGLGSGTFNQNMHTDIAKTSTGVFYATMPSNAGSRGVWRSENGINWTNITPTALQTGTVNRIVLDVSPSNENNVYFLANTPNRGTRAEPGVTSNTEGNMMYKYTYISGNGTGAGGSWVDLTSNIPSDANAYFTYDSQSAYNMVVKVDPYDDDLVFIGGTNLFRSTNGFSSKGETTQIGGYNPQASTRFNYRYPNHHPDVHGLIFRPNQSGSRMYSADDGGLHYTSNHLKDSVDWEERTGIVGGQFYTVEINHKLSSDVVVGGLQDNGTQWTNSSNANFPWTSPNLGDGSFCAVDPSVSVSGAGNYYFSSQYGNLTKTQLSNTGQILGYKRFDPPGYSFSFINPFELDKTNPNYLFLASGNDGKILRHSGVRSLVLDDTQQQQAAGWTQIANINAPVTAMQSTSTAPIYRLYVGTSAGRIFRLDQTNTATAQVTEISNFNNYRNGTYVSDIAVNPEDGNEIMAVFSNYNVYSVYHSADGGDTWTGVAGNLEDPLPQGAPESVWGIGNGPSVRCAEILPIFGGGKAYFVGTSVGLFATDSLAGTNTNWIPQGSESIGMNIVEDMASRPLDGFVAVATHGNGVFTGTIEDIEQVLSVTDTEEQKTLEMASFPNPSQGVFTLSVSNEKALFNSISIHDSKGSVVHSEIGLENEGKLSIDISHVEKGVYFVTAKTSEGILTNTIWVQ